MVGGYAADPLPPPASGDPPTRIWVAGLFPHSSRKFQRKSGDDVCEKQGLLNYEAGGQRVTPPLENFSKRRDPPGMGVGGCPFFLSGADGDDNPGFTGCPTLSASAAVATPSSSNPCSLPGCVHPIQQNARFFWFRALQLPDKKEYHHNPVQPDTQFIFQERLQERGDPAGRYSTTVQGSRKNNRE